MRVRRYLSFVAPATLFALFAIGAGPGPATAAATQVGVWQAPVFVIPDAYVVDSESMQAISCASAGNCSAVGTFKGTLERNGSPSYEGFVVSETDGTWGAAQLVADDNDDVYRFTAISCSSSGNCAAVGNDPGQGFAFAMDQTAGAWGAPQDIVASASLSSVSCSSDGDCTAAGSSGYGGQALAVSESAGTWGTAEVLPGPLNTDAGLTSISCSSAGNCSTGGYYDAQPDGPLPDEGYPLVADETGGTWGPVKDLNGSFNDVADDDVDAVSSVSCSSAGNCSAGGYYGTYAGDTHAFVVSESDGTWGQVVEVAQSLDESGSEIASISCPTDGNCSAGGDYVDGDANPHAMVVEETDGVWQPAQEVAGSLNVGDYAQITSVSCPSAGNCSAAGYYANEAGGFVGLVVTETDGSWDSGQDVATSPFSGSLGADGLAQINSISCPSVNNCAAVGVLDDINDIQQAFVVAEIPKNTQTITFIAPSQGTVNGSAVLTPSASSGLPVALSLDASTTNDACTLLDGDTVIYQQVGSCVLDANQAGNGEFGPAPQVQQTIDVEAASQTITFPAPATGTVDGSAVLAPIASSGLTVALSVGASTTNDACVVDGDTVYYEHVGSCVLDANQPGNTAYGPAPQVQQRISIGSTTTPTGTTTTGTTPTGTTTTGTYTPPAPPPGGTKAPAGATPPDPIVKVLPPTTEATATPTKATLDYRLSGKGTTAARGHKITSWDWKLGNEVVGRKETIDVKLPAYNTKYSYTLTVTQSGGETGLASVTVEQTRVKRITTKTVTRQLTVSSDTLFAWNSFALTSHAKAELNAVRAAIRASKSVVISGYCDDTGDNDPVSVGNSYNVWLSSERALAVADFLYDNKIPKTTKLVGYGRTHFVATNATAAGRAENRRVTIQFS